MERAAFDDLIDAELRRHNVEVVVLAGYMRLLSCEFVEKWQGRVLNIHPSLLPDYKGLDTHQRAILGGEEYAGCSVHIVTAELDDGPVIGQRKVKILPRDDAESLAARVLKEEHKLYPEALDLFCREILDARNQS
jgi:formyltetrahydrofolate-dependent phosphoribosylglycinamide formyltransferase